MKQVTHNLNSAVITQKLNAALSDGTLAVMVKLQNEIVQMLGRPGTGRLYGLVEGGRRRRISAGAASNVSAGGNLRSAGFHRASAPGEPPAADTGNLRKNVTIAKPQAVSKTDASGKSIGWFFGIGVIYARALEYGFPKRKLAPRPYVAPSIDKVRPEAKKMMLNAIRSAGFAIR